MSNSVRGYSLFNEIEDKDLQSRNRAVVLANIIEDNMHEKSGAVTPACMVITGEYFKAIDTKDAAAVYTFLQGEIMERKLIQGGI